MSNPNGRQFPKGIAEGVAFCNRESERKRLAENILNQQHTLIMSPRRYGKTSLVEYTAAEVGLPFGDVDLFVAIDAERVEQQIINGVKNIIFTVCNTLEGGVTILKDYFKRHNSSWTIGTKGAQFVLQPDSNTDVATNIMQALEALEALLKKKKQKALMFIDEIQEIGEVAEGKGIEGAIRHVAQKTKYLAFVFSGSNRHLLQKMFYDKNRPLYKLCDRILLERISNASYIKHLNKLAMKRWKKKLSVETLQAIFETTENHPYYVNSLCAKLWSYAQKTLPNKKHVALCWHQLFKENSMEMLKELSALSVGQRKVMIEIASGVTVGLTSKQSLQRLDMTSSTTTESLKILDIKDYVEKFADKSYRIIDPLLGYSLVQHYVQD